MVETRSAIHTEAGSPARSITEGADDAFKKATKAVSAGVAKAKSKVAASVPRDLSLGQLYACLGLSYITALLPTTFSPLRAAEVLYGHWAEPPEEQHAQTLGLLSTVFIQIACISFCLEEAARKGVGAAPGAELVRDGLLAFTALSLLSHVLSAGAFTPVGWAFMLFTQIVTLIFLAGTSRLRLPHHVESAERQLHTRLRQALRLSRNSILGHGYLALALACPVIGAVIAMFPNTTLYHTFGYIYGRSTLLPWRQWGLCLCTIVPATALFLKDKAETGRLRRSTSRTLNAGLFAASVGELMVFSPVLAGLHGGFLLPLAVLGATLSCVLAILGFTAPELEELAEQLVEGTTESGEE